MDIIFYRPTRHSEHWIAQLQQALPQARVRNWQPGDNDRADYALVWNPPVEMLAGRQALRAVFVLGAGVDALLSQLRVHPQMLPDGVPLYRLEDTGMAQQMMEYAVSQVLRWFRRFDDYQMQQQQACWQPLEIEVPEAFHIGVMGAGVLGSRVATSLAGWGVPVSCWSRSHKQLPGVKSYAGPHELDAFLAATRVLINLLPGTPDTDGIINAQRLDRLQPDAFVLNLARGAHVVERDLLAALESGKVNRAMLDVFQHEPLPVDSALWRHPRVAITPHVAALTRPHEAVGAIASTIAALERGETGRGRVDVAQGY